MLVPDALRLLSEPRREVLVRALWASERSAGELAALMPEITFGAVSQHLARLRDAGLVRVRKAGRQRIYRVEREAFGPLAEALDRMWAEQLERLKGLAEAEAKRRSKARKREGTR